MNFIWSLCSVKRKKTFRGVRVVEGTCERFVRWNAYQEDGGSNQGEGAFFLIFSFSVLTLCGLPFVLRGCAKIEILQHCQDSFYKEYLRCFVLHRIQQWIKNGCSKPTGVGLSTSDRRRRRAECEWQPFPIGLVPVPNSLWREWETNCLGPSSSGKWKKVEVEVCLNNTMKMSTLYNTIIMCTIEIHNGLQ